MEKRTSIFENGLIWFGAGVSIAEIITGTSFAALGFSKGIAAIIIGHVIGCFLLFAAGVVGVSAALLLAHTDTRSLFDKFKEFISVLTAGLAGLFFIGIFLRRVGGRAAVAGLVLNYAACFALRYAPLPFERPHVFLVGGIGFVLCVVSAWLLSFIVPERERDLADLAQGILKWDRKK